MVNTSNLLQDPKLSWNCPTPCFSRCFLKTIPVVAPLLLLLICVPVELYLLSHKKKRFTKHQHELQQQLQQQPIPLNMFNLTRLLAVAVIVGINALQFVDDFHRSFILPSKQQQQQQPQNRGFADSFYSIGNVANFVSNPLEAFSPLSCHLIRLTLKVNFSVGNFWLSHQCTPQARSSH